MNTSKFFGLNDIIDDDDDDIEINTEMMNNSTPSILDTDFKSSYKNEDMFPSQLVKTKPQDLSEFDFDSDSDSETIKDKKLKFQTNNQKKSRIAQSAMEDIPEITDFDFRKYDDEDEKTRVIDEIEALFAILKEDQIDVSNVKMPDANDTLKNLCKVRDHLKLKNDRERARTIAEELMIAGAQTLEYAFDGQKEYLGRKPDLTGWSDTVGVKMRRMRFETSSLVNSLMKHQNISPGFRILLELVPSAILYSRTSKKGFNNNLYTSSQMDNAMNTLRDIHDAK